MSLQTPSLRKAREDAQKHALKAWMNLAVDIGHAETDQIFREATYDVPPGWSGQGCAKRCPPRS